MLVGGAGHDMVDGDEADDIDLRRQRLPRPRRSATGRAGASRPCAGRSSTAAATSRRRALARRRPPRPRTTPACSSSTASARPTATRTARRGGPSTTSPNLFHDVASTRASVGRHASATTTSPAARRHDLLFGQLGNDVIQGDGGIDAASPRWWTTRRHAYHVGASARRSAASAPPARWSATYTGVLVGHRLVRGGHRRRGLHRGQRRQRRDLRRTRPGRHRRRLERLLLPRHPDERPDGLASPSAAYLPGDDRGADILFGGAGTQIGINNQTSGTASAPGLAGGILADSTAPANMDARDADTIVGDNGRIIRIVGVNGNDINGNASGDIGVRRAPAHRPLPNYVTFNYDTYGDARQDAAPRRPRRAPARLHRRRAGLPPAELRPRASAPTATAHRHSRPARSSLTPTDRRNVGRRRVADRRPRRGARRDRRRHRLHRRRPRRRSTATRRTTT